MVGNLLSRVDATRKPSRLLECLSIRSSISALLGVLLAASITSACGGPARSVAAFCQTYNQQKTAYLAKYNAIDSQLNADENSDPLAAAFGGLGSSLEAMGDVVVIFDRLDQVAPPNIEPDVKAIYNSLVNEENDMSNAASNPLGALAGGLVTGLMTSGSWQRVGDYVTSNCT
jgi:hypothetical protein